MKKTFMPPKMPKVRGMTLPKFKSHLKPPVPPRKLSTQGGPWHGSSVSVAVADGGTTMVFRSGEFHGKYTRKGSTLIWSDER